MRRLSRSVHVNAPGSFALAYMQTYFLERGPHTGDAELSLRFPLPHVFVGGLTLEKRVNVVLSYGGGVSETRAGLRLEWRPRDSPTLPAFSGILTTAEAETDATCLLTIAGRYAPPGGFAGAIFDQIVGVWIARATVTALLAQFRDAIETDYSRRLIP